MKRENGITLIVLVVTIVVLMILAGISISVLSGENGIITQSRKAKEETEIAEEKEIVNESSAIAAKENVYGYIEEDILQEVLDDRVGKDKTTVSKFVDTIFVTFNETQRTYPIDADGQISTEKDLEEAVIMREFMTKTNIDGKAVEKIFFTNTKEGPNGIETYDISEEQNDSVRMWIMDEDENGQYEIHIGANYRIIANKDMFRFFSNFQNCVSIEGLKYLDTSRTTNMDGMFWGCQNLETLDVSNFNTSKVVNMSNLFVNCYKIKRLDVSKWDTSNVEMMIDTFRDMTSLEQIDVSNFNTSKVRTISGMFQNCLGLTKLDLSNFNTSNVTDMSRLFSFSRNLSEIDISSFDFSKVSSYDKMFYLVQAKAKIYVKNQSDKEWITNNPTTSATIEIKN